MKKQNLQDEKEDEIVNKLTWNTLRDSNLSTINEILDAKDRIIIVSIKGDVYELRKMEF